MNTYVYNKKIIINNNDNQLMKVININRRTNTKRETRWGEINDKLINSVH